MATYAIFNYQFDKIIEHARQTELDGMGEILMTADEAYPRKQELFGNVLKRDYQKGCAADIIHFRNAHGQKEYIHRHLIPPIDEIFVMRVANRKTQTIVDAELKEKQVDDYQNCIVMIDNRPGIQRMLIENKKAAFRDVKQVAGILQYTFRCLLKRYSLTITLDHLQDPRDFWKFVNDRRAYPKGFHRIHFHLPSPNLERLKKVYDRLVTRARESFESSLDMDFSNPDGQVRLDPEDPYQKELIEWFMGEAGGDIALYSNLAKRSPIVVGKNSYRAITVSDTTIRRLTEDANSGDIFGSAALDDVKRKLKTGIDLSE